MQGVLRTSACAEKGKSSPRLLFLCLTFSVYAAEYMCESTGTFPQASRMEKKDTASAMLKKSPAISPNGNCNAVAITSSVFTVLPTAPYRSHS